ncbi:MAG: ATP-binding cassette domain-containing protein, partial [Planctomycetota bacterium]|nr:ATP-binding cassette domain-containing protein [Planctomycetota bacterium]
LRADHALVGRHNEGKSTLCGIMTGRLAPTSGQVVAAGIGYQSLDPIRARRLGIAGLSSAPRIYPKRTVLENLVAEDGSRWFGLLPTRRQARLAAAWLGERGIALPLGAYMHEIPRELWVIVETLAKLYRRPRFLVMDQAIEELKQPWLGKLLGLLRRHLAEGMGLLMVTHRMEDALAIADRVTVMRRGQIIATNPTTDMERLSLIRLSYAQLDDYDERFANQEKFQELMRYTEAMLRDLPSAVIILATNQHIRFVNRAAQRLFSGALRKGGELFGGQSDALRAALLEATGSGRDAELHSVSVMTDAGQIIADVRIRSLRENNAKVGIIIVIDDVSLREDLRRRLMLSEQLSSIGLLAAGVAHEVNNPLEIISNYLHYLRDDPAAPDSGETISQIEDEVARIHEIVNTLVSSSSKEKGEVSVDVMALARELSVLLGFHAGFRDVRFEFDEPEQAVAVRVAPSEMRRILLNLMRNSIDAMKGSGTLRVGCGVEADEGGGHVVLTIADTGPGIAMDNPNDVFLPFITTKKGQGSHQGMGLYIVYGIVEKYGGSIVPSNSPGGGCVFTLRFPLSG